AMASSPPIDLPPTGTSGNDSEASLRGAALLRLYNNRAASPATADLFAKSTMPASRSATRSESLLLLDLDRQRPIAIERLQDAPRLWGEDALVDASDASGLDLAALDE